MFFFRVAHQVSGIADLGFYFFLAIAEVVVCDERDDDACFRAARDLERLTIIVFFGGILPAHPISYLSLSRLIDMRESKFFLRELNQMGREDNAARMSGPMCGV